ncbi:hypothetical protein N7532_010550 [Penicillium argentinense]|uniref:LysM domain-containing protein n=1 Tax=Penicillium argentinense TaxID=1131581 RepID=A0A9W9EQ77_9EURO|nr:uncharacterized protein N7532_010550 [Penicillium argentinense]KAJ5085779.1 hypothetical protein N7532_010550 [Penicillium argentinense]
MATTTNIKNSFDYPCTLDPSSSYCALLSKPTSTGTKDAVKTPSPRAHGEIANCTMWVAPLETYDTCYIILHTYGLSMDNLYAMNPTVRKDCSGLSIGGQDDSCVDIATNHDISPGSFYEWNPAVKSDCSGLQTNEYVCVGIKAATTGTDIVTPYPIQTGIISTCDKFYKVLADDSCSDIANENDIPLPSFYDWNPAVKSNCAGLQAKEYVCVGTASISTSQIEGVATATRKSS